MRMQSHPIRQFLRPNPVTGICLFTLSLLLAACGGGGGGSGGGGGGSTTGTPAAAIGTVEKIGSVKVNGITFDCLNATVTYDDGVVDAGEDRCIEAQRRGELDDSMHVVVNGKVNDDGVSGSASSVRVKHRFKGPVGSIDTTAQTFTILGQTIQIDDSTIFKIGNTKTTGIAGLNSLPLNAKVKVNGVAGPNGTFLATYVKTKSDLSDDSNEVKGIITAVTPDIMIGTLIIVLNGQTRPVLGACVEAEGALSGNTLLVKLGPSGFKPDDDCNGDSFSGSITKAEVEGVISGFIDDATPFKVGGQTVSLSPSATFRPAGTSVADIVNGLKVEVEGSVTNGVLLATKVKIKRNGVRIEALADSAVTGNSFTILGITVITNGSTDFNEVTLAMIGNGIGLRVEGFKSGATEITATRIELRPVDANDVTLRGPLDANAVEPGFNILGVPVTIGDGTQFDDTIRANFFANATANTIVKAKGEESADNTIAAREVELED